MILYNIKVIILFISDISINERIFTVFSVFVFPFLQKSKKYYFPKGVFFILATEFCERFSFEGLRGKIISAAEHLQIVRL